MEDHMEYSEIFWERQKEFFGGTEDLLAQLLWCEYIDHKYEASGFFYLVIKDCGKYKKGEVYPWLHLHSDIPPGCYLELSWGEFYRWYGLWSPLIAANLNVTKMFKDDGIKSTDEILTEYEKNHAEDNNR